jgi:hypothetical protein
MCNLFFFSTNHLRCEMSLEEVWMSQWSEVERMKFIFHILNIQQEDAIMYLPFKEEKKEFTSTSPLPLVNKKNTSTSEPPEIKESEFNSILQEINTIEKENLELKQQLSPFLELPSFIHKIRERIVELKKENEIYEDKFKNIINNSTI